MCDEAVRMDPYSLEFVPNRLKTQEMCEKAFRKNPWSLMYIPNRYKTQGMCNEVAQKGLFLLEHVHDWFVLQGQLKLLDKYKGFCINYLYDRAIKWYNGYQKRKSQKAKTKEELLPIGCHPSRYWDWCMSEDEEKEIEKLWK